MSDNAEIVQHHIDSFVRGDVDEMMKDFAPDAVILAGPRPTKGTDAIRAFVAGASADKLGYHHTALSELFATLQLVST